MNKLPTPDEVLKDWIGDAAQSAEAAEARSKIWFTKSFETDARLAEAYIPLISALVNGLAYDWAERGPRARLAAIIALDQFSRNIFRGHALSFHHDRLALGLTKEGLMKGEDKDLSEVERVFFYIPLEHSERLTDQDLSIGVYKTLLQGAREAFKPMCEDTLDYAHRHRDVIATFGRFPHRNAILKRPNTPDEAEYLSEPGAGF